MWPRLDRFERRLAWAALLFVAVLGAFALFGHPVQAVGVENDNYVAMADRLLRGELPTDEFHPLLYPLLIAGLSPIAGGTFAAAKLISVLSAGVFLVASALLARRMFGAAAAGLTALLLACKRQVLVKAVQAGSDMLNAALVTLGLWLTLRTVDVPRRAHVLALAAACALAYFTRYPSSLLLLPALIAVWMAPAHDRTARCKRSLLFVAAVAVFLAPHWILNWSCFGSPLHDASWRNVALKYFGAMDWSYLQSMPFDGMLSVLLHDPATLAQHAGEDLDWLVRDQAPDLLLGGAPDSWTGFVVLVPVLIGIVLGLRHPSTRYWLVLLYGVAHALVTCIAFISMPRLLLPTLPVWYAAAGAALVRGAQLARAALRDRWKRIAVPVAVALLAVIAMHTPPAVQAFAAAHPWEEIEAATQLSERSPYPFRTLAQYGDMGRVVGPRFLPLHAVGAADPAEYLRRAIAEAEEHRAEFILLGPVSLADEGYFARLCATTNPRIETVRHDARVLILRVLGVAPDWIARGHAEPAEHESGPLVLEVDLRDGVDAECVGPVHVVITSPAGQRVIQKLERAAPLVYRLTMDDPHLVRGAWTVLPFVADRAGTFGAGPTFSFLQR